MDNTIGMCKWQRVPKKNPKSAEKVQKNAEKAPILVPVDCSRVSVRPTAWAPVCMRVQAGVRVVSRLHAVVDTDSRLHAGAGAGSMNCRVTAAARAAAERCCARRRRWAPLDAGAANAEVHVISFARGYRQPRARSS